MCCVIAQYILKRTDKNTLPFKCKQAVLLIHNIYIVYSHICWSVNTVCSFLFSGNDTELVLCWNQQDAAWTLFIQIFADLVIQEHPCCTDCMITEFQTKNTGAQTFVLVLLRYSQNDGVLRTSEVRSKKFPKGLNTPMIDVWLTFSTSHLRNHSSSNLREFSLGIPVLETRHKQCTNMMPFIIINMQACYQCPIQNWHQVYNLASSVDSTTAPTEFSLPHLQVWRCTGFNHQLLQA